MPQLYDSPWGALQSPPPQPGSYDPDLKSYYLGGDPRKPTSWRDEGAENIVRSIDQFMDIYNNAALPITGAHAPMSNLPGTNAYRAEKGPLDTIRSNLTLEKMFEMKAQSKTGATGFGSLSQKELETLQKYSGSLDLGIGDELVLENLANIRSKLTGQHVDLKGQMGRSRYFGLGSDEAARGQQLNTQPAPQNQQRPRRGVYDPATGQINWQ